MISVDANKVVVRTASMEVPLSGLPGLPLDSMLSSGTVDDGDDDRVMRDDAIQICVMSP